MTHETSTPNNNQAPTVWVDVYPKLLELGVSTDVHARATQVAGTTGEGLRTMFANVHTIVAPDIDHTPTASAMHIEAPDGSRRRELMQPADRELLMDHAAGLIRALAERRQTPDEDRAFLKRAAHVSALAGVLAHTYSDGNGRSARTVAQLIREGLDPSDPESVDDMKVLSANRPEKGYKIYSYLPAHEGLDMSPVQLLEAAASLDIPYTDQAAYDTIKNSAFTAPFPD